MLQWKLYLLQPATAHPLSTLYSPLSNTVWMCLTAAIAGTGFIYFIMLTVSERVCRRRNNHDTHLTNLMNSIWIMIRSFLSQGSLVLSCYIHIQFISRWLMFTEFSAHRCISMGCTVNKISNIIIIVIKTPSWFHVCGCN